MLVAVKYSHMSCTISAWITDAYRSETRDIRTLRCASSAWLGSTSMAPQGVEQQEIINTTEESTKKVEIMTRLDVMIVNRMYIYVKKEQHLIHDSDWLWDVILWVFRKEYSSSMLWVSSPTNPRHLNPSRRKKHLLEPLRLRIKLSGHKKSMPRCSLKKTSWKTWYTIF